MASLKPDDRKFGSFSKGVTLVRDYLLTIIEKFYFSRKGTMIVVSATDNTQTDMRYMRVYTVITTSHFRHAYLKVRYHRTV